jgi:hypothetical protein
MSACIEGRLDLVQYFFERIAVDKKVNILFILYSFYDIHPFVNFILLKSTLKLQGSMRALVIKRILSSTLLV